MNSNQGTLPTNALWDWGKDLVDQNLLSLDQLNVALIEQANTGKPLEKLLVELGFLTETILSTFISKQKGLDSFSIDSTAIDPESVPLLPKDFCEKHKVLVTTCDASVAYVAMADVHDIRAIDALRQKLQYREIIPLVAAESELMRAIDMHYGHEMSLDGILKEIEKGEAFVHAHDDVLSPTVRLVNAIILDAVKKNASDIHFEPEGQFLRIRYRMDGLLVLMRTLHIRYWSAMNVRIKIIAGMNIANSRLPQNGRFTLHLGARDVDFRVSSQPIVHGENLVIRILDKSHSLRPLEELGYGAENVELIKKILKAPAGLIIITGPTGSGKTTSLYSMLNFINTPDVNIMTLEDPIEYKLPWIRQTEIQEPGGLGFAEGVRSILRQDPDIIFIGEIRDETTASMALRSSMTGHKVFTTLHTNDAFSALYRLQDLQLDPAILAGNMVCSIAQRLIRKLCENCKVPVTEGSTSLNESLGVYKEKGCSHCHHTGYKGRTAIVEVLHFTEAMNDLISARGSRQEFKTMAQENGFMSMVEHGLYLVEEGITSMQEFERVMGVHT